MKFRYRGLSRAQFEPWLRMSDAELEAIGARRTIADEKPGFPCRISLEDAEPGERVVLLSYAHQSANSPFKACGPIFVREAAMDAYDSDSMPPVFRVGRLLSARAYDRSAMMIEADVAGSEELELLLERLFACGGAEYVDAHYARRGCFAARIERA